MGGSSGGGTSTTIQKSDPWAGAQPYLKDIMGQAQTAYNNSANNQYFPGSTVVPFSPQQQQSMDMIQNRATNGSPLMDAAKTDLQKTVSGGYLDPTQNPAYQAMSQNVTNQVNSQFGAAGRTGSGMNQEALARGITQGGADLYNQERQRQMQAQLFAPQMANQDYYDAGMLGQVGAAQQQQAGNVLTDQMNRYNYNQNLPWQNLNQYSAILNGYGGLGGSSSITQPAAQTNQAASGIGGALAGGQLGSSFGPWGAGIGAVGGGLLGLFGK